MCVNVSAKGGLYLWPSTQCVWKDVVEHTDIKEIYKITTYMDKNITKTVLY